MTAPLTPPCRRSRSENLRLAREKGRHTDLEWLVMKHLFKVCVKCRDPAWNIEKDHIRPICIGGSDSIDNLQPLCARCNTSKTLDCTDYRDAALPDWRAEFNRRIAIVLE